MNPVSVPAFRRRLPPTAAGLFGSSVAALGLVFAGLLCARAQAAADSPYRINVNSMVDRAYTRFSKEPYHDHGKRYAIISATPVAEYPLAKPVNEAALLSQLRSALASRGFREAASGPHPDIVLTVVYGRSHLANPYTRGSVQLDTDNGVATAVAGETEARALSTPGGAERLIAAGAEKLFIAVCAWQFPTREVRKPKMVWRTVINTDDPDEDLNLLSEKMLKAGSAYFDQPINGPEITFSSDLPEGRVKLGAPTVVEPKAK